MYSSLSGRFVPNKGGVAGYVDRMRRKYRAKWGMLGTKGVSGAKPGGFLSADSGNDFSNTL